MEEYVSKNDVMELLKRIRACLTYEDWGNAKRYIDIELQYIQKNNKITKVEDIKIGPFLKEHS